MADTITFDQAIDIGYGTLQDIRRRTPPLATYAYPNYDFFNLFFKGNVKTVGDKLEGHVTLGSEGNAQHQSFWAEDALIKKNIQQRYRLDWRLVSGGMVWNLIEQAINKSPSAIYNVWQSQYDSAVKDLVEEIYDTILAGPTSSSDTDRPYSIFSWLSCGTENTEGFTGYKAHYNDGVDVDNANKVTFAKAGIDCSSTTNPDWASYYADHEGNLDDGLLTILDTAARKLNFRPPVVPRTLPMEKVNFALYSNNTVIKSLNAFYRNSDDNMGYRPDGYFGLPTFKRIPIAYCAPLDTTKDDIYGKDPIVGVNHQVLYPVILRGFDFTITKRPDANRHNVMSLFIDLVYQVWCNTSPKYAGFLISNHPANY